MRATLRMSATRFAVPASRHPGKARSAAAIAASTSCALAWGNRPILIWVSIGLARSSVAAAGTSLPSMCIGCVLPSWPRIFESARSKRSCSSSGGLNMVA
jgi:hypothetical protein